MFAGLEGDARALLREVTELVYFMRGSVQYDDMLRRTYAERQIFQDFVRERLEAESKKMYPVY